MFPISIPILLSVIGVVAILGTILYTRFWKEDPSTEDQKEVLSYFSKGEGTLAYPQIHLEDKLRKARFGKVAEYLVAKGFLYEFPPTSEVSRNFSHLTKYDITEEGRKYLSNLSQTDLA